MGIKETASPEEIKRAHRRLVMEFHPDRNPSADASSKFIEVTKAYEVLSDPARRADYDRVRKTGEESRKRKQSQNPASTKQPSTNSHQPKGKAAPVSQKLQEERLRKLMIVGNVKAAEILARAILSDNPRSATSYAALGDIERSRGDWKSASKMYAYAAQFDPRNELYLRKHEEMLDQYNRIEMTRDFQRNQESRWVAPVVGIVLTVVAACYIAMSPEQSIFAKGTIISSWTVGLMSMLFFSGAVMGATLCLADYLDRFEVTTAMGRISPNLLFLLLGVVSLWVAGAIYIITGGLMRSFSITLSRLMIGLVGVVSILTIGAAGSQNIDPYEVLLWGGSVVSAGALVGWAFGDGLRD